MCANIAATQTNDSDEWRTPTWLFNLLNEEFNFLIDVAATDENALCSKWFTEADNGLVQKWSGICYCNPPYSKAAAWFKNAWSEAALGHATTVMLVAARTDTRYWWDYATKAEVRFLKGRLKFIGGKYSAPFPSADYWANL